MSTPQARQPRQLIGPVAFILRGALGKDLDARTDLFLRSRALRDGHRIIPVQGESSGAIFDDILHKDPVAPVRLNRPPPAELEQVIKKAIEKDHDLRYQSAAEMRADLERLKRDTSSGRAGSIVSPASSAFTTAQESGSSASARIATDTQSSGNIGTTQQVAPRHSLRIQS